MLPREMVRTQGAIPKKGGSARAEALPRDPHAVQRVNVENIKAASSIHHHLHEAGPSDDGADYERKVAQTSHMMGIIMPTEGDRHFRLAEVPAWHHTCHVDFSQGCYQ